MIHQKEMLCAESGVNLMKYLSSAFYKPQIKELFGNKKSSLLFKLHVNLMPDMVNM